MEGLLLEAPRGPPADAGVTGKGAAASSVGSSQRVAALSGDTTQNRTRGSKYKAFSLGQYLLTGNTEQGARWQGVQEM